MTDKTMPKALTIHAINNGDKFPDNLRVVETEAGVLLEEGVTEAEYIRSDLAEMYAFNDDFKDGQRRWVFWSLSWHLAKVAISKSGVVWFTVGDNTCGATFDKGDPDVKAIGPVVRAPKYKPSLEV